MPLLLPSLNLIHFLPPPPFSGAGWIENVGWSHLIMLCHSFLVSPFSTLVWGPYNKIESFTNFFHVGPFHRLKLCKNCSGMDSLQTIVLAGKLDPVCTHHTLQFLPGAGSIMGCSCYVDSQGTFTCSSVGSSIDSRQICAPVWSSMGCRGTAASPWSAPVAAAESLL